MTRDPPSTDPTEQDDSNTTGNGAKAEDQSATESLFSRRATLLAGLGLGGVGLLTQPATAQPPPPFLQTIDGRYLRWDNKNEKLDFTGAAEWENEVENGGPNDVHGDASVVAGGRDNGAGGPFATVGGGRFNVVDAERATISGGFSNEADAVRATVGGGQRNDVNGDSATIGGGRANSAFDDYATASGGVENRVRGFGSTIGGGESNLAAGDYDTVGGGKRNVVDAESATVAGGEGNDVKGKHAVVPGGEGNTASGEFSFAAGRRAHAKHDGAFVFGDSSSTGIQSQNADEIRSQMPMYAPAFNSTSARAKKEAVEPVNPEAVLDAVTDLEVSTWTFKHNGGGRHMGPMAEDFDDAFGLGDDDGHIASVDADGVALAAIQGLSQRLDKENERLRDELAEKDDRIKMLESEKEELEERLAAVEKQIGLDGHTAQPVAGD